MRYMIQRLLAAATLAIALSRPAHAQNTVTLEGLIRSDGIPIAGAQVTAVNIATNETVRATTRANGEFRVIGLFTGEYTVTVRVLGYKQNVQAVRIATGQRARLPTRDTSMTEIHADNMHHVWAARLHHLPVRNSGRQRSANDRVCLCVHVPGYEGRQKNAHGKAHAADDLTSSVPHDGPSSTSPV